MTLGVRTVHVLAAAVALGAPIALALVLAARPDVQVVERLVTPAERLQWSALAVLVATGVGNLAAFEDGLPGGRWETAFLVKLGLVFAILVLSAVRTFFIANLASGAARQPRRLRDWYAVTGGIAALVVVLGQVMAHG